MRENASQDATAGTFLALEIRSLPVECRSCVGAELNGSVNSLRRGGVESGSIGLVAASLMKLIEMQMVRGSLPYKTRE